MVGDAEELVARPYPLAVDHLLLDDVASCGRQPVNGARTLLGFSHFPDAIFGNTEIAQPLHGSVELAFRLRSGETARPDTHRYEHIDLRLHDVGAVDAEQRLAGADVLANPIDKQIFDVSIRAHGDDGQ